MSDNGKPELRFLHTADWHLGREFHGADLGPSHAAFFDWLVEVVEAERIDVVLMAGDVYDRALPPVAAVELLHDSLNRLAERTRVVLISGNHDSIARMGFGALCREEIRLRSGVAGLGTPVLIERGGSRAAVYPVPYLEPGLSSEDLEVEERTHEGVMAAALGRAAADLRTRPAGTRAIAVAHAFVMGGKPSDSERQLAIGGAERVPLSAFDPFDYSALGHLHRPQRLSEKVVYSGSPVAYSFSEVGAAGSGAGAKSVELVTVPGDGPVRTERLEVPTHRPAARLHGELAKLLEDPALERFTDHWLDVTLTDVERPRSPMDRLRSRFPGALTLRFAHDPRPENDTGASLAERISERDPLELAADFVEHVALRRPQGAEEDLLREALDRSAARELTA